MAAVNYEWSAQEKLRIDTLEKMKVARADYEREILELEIEAEKIRKQAEETMPSKKKKKTKKAKKGKKLEPPPIVDENTIIDISDHYRKLETKITEQFYDSIHPKTLLLEPNEVKTHLIVARVTI